MHLTRAPATSSRLNNDGFFTSSPVQTKLVLNTPCTNIYIRHESLPTVWDHRFVSSQEMGLMEPLVYADLASSLDPPSGGGGPAGGGQGGSGGGGAEPSPVSTAAGGFSEAVQPSDGGGSSDRFSDARPPTTYR